MTVPFCILAEIFFLNDTPINPKQQQQQQQQQQLVALIPRRRDTLIRN